MNNLAQFACSNVFNRLVEFRSTSLPSSHLNNSLKVFLRANHRHRFSNVVTNRLFAINILTRFTCMNQVQSMPVIGSTNDYRINIFSLQHLSVIVIHRRLATIFRFNSLKVTRNPVLIHVAKCSNFNIFMLHKVAHVCRTHATTSNQTKNNFVVGRSTLLGNSLSSVRSKVGKCVSP